jgi:hypothetical protein
MGIYFSSKLEELNEAKVSHLTARAIAEVNPSAWEGGVGFLTHDEVRSVITNIAGRIHNGEFAANIIKQETTVDGLALSWLSWDCEMATNLIHWLNWGREETLSFS